MVFKFLKGLVISVTARLQLFTDCYRFTNKQFVQAVCKGSVTNSVNKWHCGGVPWSPIKSHGLGEVCDGGTQDRQYQDSTLNSQDNR